jgi:hypothetical protein
MASTAAVENEATKVRSHDGYTLSLLRASLPRASSPTVCARVRAAARRSCRWIPNPPPRGGASACLLHCRSTPPTSDLQPALP